jgi:hypothetical protein
LKVFERFGKQIFHLQDSPSSTLEMASAMLVKTFETNQKSMLIPES